MPEDVAQSEARRHSASRHVTIVLTNKSHFVGTFAAHLWETHPETTLGCRGTFILRFTTQATRPLPILTQTKVCGAIGIDLTLTP